NVCSTSMSSVPLSSSFFGEPDDGATKSPRAEIGRIPTGGMSRRSTYGLSSGAGRPGARARAERLRSVMSDQIVEHRVTLGVRGVEVERQRQREAEDGTRGAHRCKLLSAHGTHSKIVRRGAHSRCGV